MRGEEEAELLLHAQVERVVLARVVEGHAEAVDERLLAPAQAVRPRPHAVAAQLAHVQRRWLRGVGVGLVVAERRGGQAARRALARHARHRPLTWRARGYYEDVAI